MRKNLKFTLILVLMLSVLFSCSTNENTAPEGLQVAKENKAGGYIFYAPEHWSIINTPDVCCAKVSAINNTSISFVEAKMPNEDIRTYFENSLAEFPSAIAETMKITLRDEKCEFGNANGEAYKYIYTYEYQDHDFACMQILLTHSDRFYIFTYTSYGDVTDDSSTYRQYLSAVQLAIDNFTFTESNESEPEKEYTKDEDGYNIVSDEAVTGYSLYLPEDYEVVYSDGFIRAKISSGANISLSQATQTGIGILDYLKLRKEEMQVIATDFSDVAITLATEIEEGSGVLDNWKFDVKPSYDEAITFGNLEKGSIIVYEYTYVFDGRMYHVYQLMGVDSINGYVFTYTALENEYHEHIDEIKTILEKVKF